MLSRLKRGIFNQIHKRNLIYNQCWEDPQIDQRALQISSTDRVAMITSAGCNALHYLLYDPEHIDCVDMNPHQTALLELKLAAIANLNYDQFFEMFGRGKLNGYRQVYERRLRDSLSPSARTIWDRRIRYFRPGGPGLYFSGTAGLFARVIRAYLCNSPSFRGDLEAFQRINDLGVQATFYLERIAPRLWNKTVCRVLEYSVVMSLLGVPIDQMELAASASIGTLGSFIRRRVDDLFTKTPIRENYFWRAYMNGGHTMDCCPEYLKRENFQMLKQRIGRVRVHTNTLTGFLRSVDERFSVYVLLDHMDWMEHDPDELHEEWHEILRTARPDARIIFRSAAVSGNPVPDFAIEKLRFDPVASALHQQDRVGTYGSFHLAKVCLA